MQRGSVFKKVLLAVVSFVVVLVGFVFLQEFVLVPIAHQQMIVPKVTEAKKEFYIHQKKFDDDLNILIPKLRFLEKGERKKDAGEFLNVRLLAEGLRADLKVKWEEKRDQLSDKIDRMSEKDQRVYNRVVKDGASIEDYQGEFDHIDTSWLRKLRDYDYWSIDVHGPMQDYQRISFDSPIPYFGNRHQKIHLFNSFKGDRKRKIEALKDILHYGELAFTTESLIGSMVFASSLGVVKWATENQKELRKELGPWQVLLEEKQRIKRVFWGIHHFTRPMLGFDQRVMQSYYKKLNATVGLCSVAREVFSLGYPIWSSTVKNDFLEMKKYKDLVMSDHRGCRYDFLTKKTPAWVKLPGDYDSFFQMPGAFDTVSLEGDTYRNKLASYLGPLVEYMPNTRTFAMQTLMYLAVPSFVGLYNTMEEKES